MFVFRRDPKLKIPQTLTVNNKELFENLCTCKIGYSDFHNLMGLTSKKMPKNILKMFVKKFNLLSHFLQI